MAKRTHLLRVNSRLSAQMLFVSIFVVLCSPVASISAGEESPQDDDETSAQCQKYTASHERESARDAILRGLSCFEVGRYDWALTHYLNAYSISPEPHLLGVIGRSMHELGFYEPAKGYYKQFLSQEIPPSGAERIRIRVEELDTLLDEKAGTLSLNSSPSGARAYLVLENGAWYELGQTPLELRLKPGSYDVAFDHDHYRPHHTRSRVRSGERQELSPELVSRESTINVSGRNQRRAGLWTIGGSLPTAAAGITLLTLSLQNTSAAQRLENDFDDLSDYDRRRRDHLDAASRYRLFGTITTAVGITGLIVGTVLYLSAPEPTTDDDVDLENDIPAENAQSWSLEPTVGFNQLGFRLRF